MLPFLFYLVLWPILLTPAYAEEGFFSLTTADVTLQTAFLEFPEKYDCGSVRIHDVQPFYLTALHCIRKQFDPDQYISIGNPANSESLNIYRDLSGQNVQLGDLSFTVVANGGCWTGFALDVIADASSSEREQAIRCLIGDWVILKLTSRARMAQGCLKVELAPRSGGKVIAIGGPRMVVTRNHGLTELDGRIFSRGNLFRPSDLLNDFRYSRSLAATWNSFKSEFIQENSDFLLTDSDIINGMSGGPVVQDGRLIGVSTVGLLPNYLFQYPELVPIADGYNFGIHGGISLRQIITAQNARYFSCR